MDCYYQLTVGCGIRHRQEPAHERSSAHLGAMIPNLRLQSISLALLLFILPSRLSAQTPDVRQSVVKGLTPALSDGKWGYTDASGNFVIHPQFVKARKFSEGLAAVEVETEPPSHVATLDEHGNKTPVRSAQTKWGFVDATGKLVIKAEFSAVQDFAEGLAAASYEVPWGFFDSWGYIDKQGKMVIKPQFSRADAFSEGLALVWCCSVQLGDAFEQGFTKQGYIDRAGRWLFQSRYWYFFNDDFSEGLVPFRKNFGKWGYMDKAAQMVIKPQFSWAGKFSQGLAPVLVNGKCAHIDATGTIIGEPQPEKPAEGSEKKLRRATRDVHGTVVMTVNLPPPCP